MSEGVAALIEAGGFAAYGRWCTLLEVVASKMDSSARCHVEYPASQWCSLLKLKRKKLISFLELTENKLKTKVVYSENIIRIEIPNLLNKRDNYTKDLEVKSKRLPSIEVEVEEDKEEEKTLPQPPQKKGAMSELGDELVRFWNEVCGEAGLPLVTKMTKARLTKMRLRLQSYPEEAFWEEVVNKIAESDFLKGGGPTGWKATFDWLIRNDENALRVKEGYYEHEAKRR